MQDGERHADGTVTYYYVAHGRPQAPGQQTNYGTVGNNTPSGGQFPGQQTGFVQPQQQQPKANGDSAQPQHGVAGGEINGEGSSQPAGPPPTYADVIKGDNKVQGP